MHQDGTLNLSDIDPPIWRLLSGKIAYGPYTLGQLKRLIEDNQLTRTSKLAKGDNSPFLPASAHPAIVRLFAEEAPAAPMRAAIAPRSGRFVLVFYGDNQSRDSLIETLNSVGEFAELVYGTFVLISPQTIAELQRALASVCGGDECFVLTEADTGRLAWHGVADEISDHVRTLWKS